MANCPRTGKLLGGCKFSPRYDLGEPQRVDVEECSAGAYIAILEASKPKTYVRDVCERCGKTVER